MVTENDFEDAYLHLDIDPISLYLYYKRLGFYTKNPKSGRFCLEINECKSRAELVTREAYDTASELYEYSPFETYRRFKVAIGFWPEHLKDARAECIEYMPVNYF